MLLFSLCSAAVAYLIWAPKIYESRAVIAVEQETPKVNNIQDFNADSAEDIKSPEVLKTIEQALLSQTLLLRVVKANGLDKDPSFAPPKKDGSPYLDTELVGRFEVESERQAPPRNATDRCHRRRHRSETGTATCRVDGQGVRQPEL